jgi:hypothetical protein
MSPGEAAEQAVEADGRPQTAAHRLTARRSADWSAIPLAAGWDHRPSRHQLPRLVISYDQNIRRRLHHEALGVSWTRHPESNSVCEE